MNAPLTMPAHGRFAPQGIRTEANPKWVRGYLDGTGDADDGTLIVDSTDTLFVWEMPYYPQWFFPAGDLVASLEPTGETKSTPGLGEAIVHDLIVTGGSDGPEGGGDRRLPAAAWIYPDSPVVEVRDRVRIDFGALDRWMEEEVEVIVHPRSPYARIDVLASSRHVIVRVDGAVVADTRRASILYETGLPPRFYLPIDDVTAGVLTPTDSSSACPYKGIARYWDLTVESSVHRDLVWGYDDPLPESAGVQGLVCFYNEKVEIEVDGRPLGQPRTKFS